MACFHLPMIGFEVCGNVVKLRLKSGKVVRIEFGAPPEATSFRYSPGYGKLAEGMELSVPVKGRLATTISILRGAK